ECCCGDEKAPRSNLPTRKTSMKIARNPLKFLALVLLAYGSNIPSSHAPPDQTRFGGSHAIGGAFSSPPAIGTLMLSCDTSTDNCGDYWAKSLLVGRGTNNHMYQWDSANPGHFIDRGGQFDSSPAVATWVDPPSAELGNSGVFGQGYAIVGL